MTASGNRRFLEKSWRGMPATFASICLLVFLLRGDIASAFYGPDGTPGPLAQVTGQSGEAQTNSENAQSGSRDQPAPGASEPAGPGGQPSDRSSPRRPSAPQREFRPSERIDVDKAVDFPVDI